jgi:hypothetical protein
MIFAVSASSPERMRGPSRGVGEGCLLGGEGFGKVLNEGGEAAET